MKTLKRSMALILALAILITGLPTNTVLAEETSKESSENIEKKTTDPEKNKDSKEEGKKTEEKDPGKDKTDPQVVSELRAFVYNIGKKFITKDGKGAHFMTFSAGAQFGQGPYKLKAEIYIKNNQLLSTLEAETDFISEFELPLADVPFGTSYLAIELEAEDAKGNKAKSRLIGTIEQEGQETKFKVNLETKPVLYYVMFDLQGGKFLDENLKVREEVKPASTYKLPAADKVEAPKGMEFVAWDVQGASMAPGNEIIVTENYTIKAIWQKIPEVEKAQIKRLAGARREDVAVNISKEFYEKADKVIVAQYMADADAMSASNVSQGRYPILFTEKDNCYKVTKDEIKRLGASEIILMGGPNTVSDKVEKELAALKGIKKVERISGKDRYEVSINSLKYMNWDKDGKTEGLVFASGLATADALAAAPFAKKEKSALVLVRKEGAEKFLKSALAEGGILKDKKISKTYTIGGPNTISEAGKKNLDELLKVNSTRIEGADRYQLAVNIAKSFDKPTALLMSNGLKWADALAAGPVAQKLGAPISLIKYGAYAKNLDSFLRETESLKNVYILGGSQSVSDKLLKFLENLLTLEIPKNREENKGKTDKKLDDKTDKKIDQTQDVKTDK